MPAWKHISGGLTRISAGSITNVWGVDAANPWVKIPGTLTDISAAADGTVYSNKSPLDRAPMSGEVNAGGNIFRYTGDDSNPWDQISGTLTNISAAADGTVWGVNAANNIFRYTGDPNHWTQISGVLKQISIGSRTNVWGVDSAAGNIYTYTGDDSNPWVKIAGGLVNIGVGADGVVWGVDSANAIFRWIRD
ncbi:tectonin 2 [Mycena olivaceomarginata]|nr:tectonin 2 [Mycena olivaceomarginata]